jgi:hypothetical protein
MITGPESTLLRPSAFICLWTYQARIGAVYASPGLYLVEICDGPITFLDRPSGTFEQKLPFSIGSEPYLAF